MEAANKPLKRNCADLLCIVSTDRFVVAQYLGGAPQQSHPRVKVSIVGSLRDREVACSASDRQGSNFESCVWRTVSSQSSHHPQEALLAQFSLYVHKGGLKPDSFHFIFLPQQCIHIHPVFHRKISPETQTSCLFEGLMSGSHTFSQ